LIKINGKSTKVRQVHDCLSAAECIADNAEPRPQKSLTQPVDLEADEFVAASTTYAPRGAARAFLPQS
jgi:hypothetical protein